MIHVPFHCLFSSAPEEYVNCVATIPIYDPTAIDRTEEVIKCAMHLGINSAIAAARADAKEGVKKWRPSQFPKRVNLPITHEEILRRDNGSGGMQFVKRTRTPLGFRSFEIAELATKPFSRVKSKAIPPKQAERLERFVQ